MKLKIIVVLFVVVFLSGCISESSQPQTKSEQPTYFTRYQIDVYHDDQRNVTCWITDTNNTFGAGIAWGGGISCLPDSQLNTMHENR